MEQYIIEFTVKPKNKKLGLKKSRGQICFLANSLGDLEKATNKFFTENPDFIFKYRILYVKD